MRSSALLLLRLALRELRGGIRDFRIFISCLIIGVAVISAVNTLSHTITEGIRNESRTLLGGDIKLSLINQRLDDDPMRFIGKYGRISETVSMRSMAMFGDEVTLVELKGVDRFYPLIGYAITQSGEHLQSVIANGSVVAEPLFMQRMNIKVGTPLHVADAGLTVSDVLLKEPDRITTALTLGPRLMGRTDLLEQKGLLKPAGLTHFHYHVLLNDDVVLSEFLDRLNARYPDAPWITKTVDENNRGVQRFISRLQLFMTLAGLSTLLIGGIGIMNAADTYLKRKAHSIAVLKTLGSSRQFVFLLYLSIIMFITVLASFSGAVAGSGLSFLALPYLEDMLPIYNTHFALDWLAIALATGFGTLTVLAFSISALGRGVEVKAASLFRGLDPTRPRLSAGKIFLNAIILGILVALLVATSSDRVIAIGFMVSTLVSFVIFMIATRFAQWCARRITFKAPWARMAVANLYRPGAYTLSIMLSTGIGLSILVALLLVESNFQKEVDETMPKVAPSLFLIDILPEQSQDIFAKLDANKNISALSYQPMMRGRISRINGVPVQEADIADSVKWSVESDRGLTYSAAPPQGTQLVKGAWWDTDYRGKTLVSLDRKLAAGMHIGIGDTLTIVALGKEIEAEISSLRDINYISFQINFAMVFSPGAIESLPYTYIATVKLDDVAQEGVLIRELARDYPNVSAVRIKDSIDQIREMVGHIAFALRLCAGVTVFAGILVLASAMAAMLDSRLYDMVVLKVLGARRSDIIKMFLSEWALLGLLTAAISTALGVIGAWLILQRLDWIAFKPMPDVIGGTIAIAMLCVMLTGIVIHTRVFNTRASTILRNE